MGLGQRMPDANPRATRHQTGRLPVLSRLRRASTKRVFASTVIATGLLLALAAAAVASGRISYTIAWGDTLNGIAAQHGTDTDTLAEVNDIENKDLIYAGDTLTIPSMQESGSSSGQQDGVYVVQEGDTLSGIARQFDVTVEELAAANQIENPDLIIAGEELVTAGAEYAQVDEGDAAAEPEATEERTPAEEPAEPSTSSGSQSAGVELHLVAADETLSGIAEQYGVTQAQLIAANGHARNGVRQGMILKIPADSPAGKVQLIGMPVVVEQWPLASEITATSLATKYWGAAVSSEQILNALTRAENPHKGFRGDYTGMYGMTEDYGVYNEPLADIIAEFGFQADAFYADGDRSALTRRINGGIPVVAWVTHELQDRERTVIENESGRYSLVPEQHAVVVYGYDDAGVDVVDVSDGQYKRYDWESFMRSWTRHFDGMGLAVAPAD